MGIVLNSSGYCPSHNTTISASTGIVVFFLNLTLRARPSCYLQLSIRGGVNLVNDPFYSLYTYCCSDIVLLSKHLSHPYL